MFQTKLYVDEAWMKRLGFGLKRFKKVKPGVYTCRCPLCGDSKKSSSKTRFYFYTKNGKLSTQCHNCGHSSSFYNFVKLYAPNDFEEYKKETLLSGFTRRNTETKPTLSKTSNVVFTEEKEESKLTILKNAVKCTELANNHPAKLYLYDRGFNDEQLARLLYTDDFKSVASQINEKSSQKLLDKEPRIVIPFYTKDGEIKLIQGRAIKESKMKYITIKQNDDVDKVYGLENLDKSKLSYCVEGPLDSLFVDNCIATCDANLIRSDADILIFDNQPRNPEVVRLIEDAINAGRKVVIWPTSPNDKVDINDMIKSGVTPDLLMKVIKKCTYSGMLAKLKFNQWRKV